MVFGFEEETEEIDLRQLHYGLVRNDIKFNKFVQLEFSPLHKRFFAS